MKIEATYRVTTPMFCGGAEPKVPELRLQSFKGVLRFWWRALAWSHYNGDLHVIQEHEDCLFGKSERQSRILMRLMPAVDSPEMRDAGEVLTPSGSDNPVGEGARYLGYGVMEAKKKNTKTGQLTRGCHREPLDFTVSMHIRNPDSKEPDLLLDSLRMLGTVGGMGSKSRKGYGSLVLLSLKVDEEEKWNMPQHMDDLRRTIATLVCPRGGEGLPEYTALSAGARHVLLSSQAIEPLGILDLVGGKLHDFMKKEVRGGKYPQSVAFGLPRNHGRGKGQQISPRNTDSRLDRRASPLFIHIHECGRTPIAVLSFLPARFLPEGPDGRSAISVGKQQHYLATENELYQPIHRFLDRLRDPGEHKDEFTKVIEVKCP